ncbi:MAG: hypothetical protein ACFFAO_02055 [Candidatus Hermodarchaeota archaeon]
MSEKVLKNKYIIEEEEEEEEIEEVSEQDILEKKILKILNKGRVDSKLTLTNLLINYGIKNYSYKINLLTNEINAEIPLIGNTLKRMRFDKKINFSIENGSHVYYLHKKQKTIKPEKGKISIDWKSYTIPEGINELYLIFKIPGSKTNSQHFLFSCYPSAEFSGFKLFVDKKHEKTHGFSIYKDKLIGFFEEDRMILKCTTSGDNIDKTLYYLIQIGRIILIELIKSNFRYSEVLKIIHPKVIDFFPIVPIFVENEKKKFFENKFNNVLRIIYDFPKEFEGKLISGKYSLIYLVSKNETFDIMEYNDFISSSFDFQTKSFVSLAILNGWIINPNKALNYIEKDDEIKNLISEYIQDIDTDRIIQEKLEESMERGEFIKEITTNLLLSLLGVSLLADWPPLQIAVVIVLIFINVFYFYKRRKKFKEKNKMS